VNQDFYSFSETRDFIRYSEISSVKTGIKMAPNGGDYIHFLKIITVQGETFCLYGDDIDNFCTEFSTWRNK